MVLRPENLSQEQIMVTAPANNANFQSEDRLSCIFASLALLSFIAYLLNSFAVKDFLKEVMRLITKFLL